MRSQLILPAVLKNCQGVLEGMAHSLEALYFQLQGVPLLDVGISTNRSYYAAHEALLRVVRKFPFDRTESALLR